MKFEVPQFIDVEDKVIGPFTFKQFIYLAGGAGVSVVLWLLLPALIAIPLIGVFIALGGALAFYKVNSKPFVSFLESMFKYSLAHKLYIWRKVPQKKVVGKEGLVQETGIFVPRLSDSKLRDLAWSLDVHDTLNETEK